MGIFLTFVLAFFLGYLYGYRIRPNKQLVSAVKEVRAGFKAALEEGRKGVYKTVVMDQSKSSELLVEVKELAVTELGQVKVQYLSAHYKNPEFRTRKGEALLNEVRDLLGEYLPLDEIEWYETTRQHENIRNHMSSLEKKYKKFFSA